MRFSLGPFRPKFGEYKFEIELTDLKKDKMCELLSIPVALPPLPLQPCQAPAREADQWFIFTDNIGKTVYHNFVTGEEQNNKPDCLKKYNVR